MAAPIKSTTRKAPVRKTAARYVSEESEPTVEHRISVERVAISVSYGRDRQEQIELRGAATMNSGDAETTLRTKGFVAMVSGRARGTGEITHDPAVKNGGNLALTVYVEEADVALLREIFVTGTAAIDAPDPALVIWARTAQPLARGESDTQAVTEFGFHLDLDPAS